MSVGRIEGFSPSVVVPTGHHPDSVVMSADIVDYAAYCGVHGENAGLELVIRQQDLLIPIVKANGGTVVKTIADAVMAYFTDPVKASTVGREINSSSKQAVFAGERDVR